MVGSISIYTLLNCIELILALTYGFFCGPGKYKKYSKIIRLICLLAVIVISSFKIPMAILLGMPYVGLIYTIIVCSIIILIHSIAEDL